MLRQFKPFIGVIACCGCHSTATAAILPCFRCYMRVHDLAFCNIQFNHQIVRIYAATIFDKRASVEIYCLVKQELIFTQHHFLLRFHIPWNHRLDMKHHRNQHYHHIQHNVLSIAVWMLYGMIPIVNNCILLFLKFKCDNRKNIYFVRNLSTKFYVWAKIENSAQQQIVK